MFGSNFWNSVTRSSRSKTATIAHEHTWSFEGRRVRKFLDRNVIAKRCHRIIAVSEHDRQRMTAVVGIPPNAITVIPTATADRHVEGSHNVDIRSDLKLSPKTPIVFTAAMLRSQKRLDVLLRAFALLDGDSPNAHLLIAGGGQLRGELEQLARTLAIHDRVHFLGVRDDISSLAQQSTLGVLSSDFEGMPLFAIECLRAGLPLVATNVGGVPELVRDNMDGVLVSRREPKALARALQDLLASDAQRAELSRNALERSQLFTAERMEQNVVRLYREILESLR
jgi:glycosyltransferase involved in cell wall biosynthesis